MMAPVTMVQADVNLPEDGRAQITSVELNADEATLQGTKALFVSATAADLVDVPSNTSADADISVQTQTDNVPDVAEPVLPEVAPESEADTLNRLAALKPMDYDRVRKSEAKALGVQVKTLDDMVKTLHNDGSMAERLPFDEVEAWPEPIDPAQVLDETVALLQRFVLMTQAQAIAVTLWIMLTWFIKDVQVAALLLINAPEKACGKSQLLTLVGYLVSRPLSAANSTVSFLFRAIQRWCPTLLVDEADTFIKENDELKGLVNAGHTRSNAFVGRTVAVGEGHEPRLFEVWAAKAFAGISLEKHFPDAAMSRGIVINMRKKMPDEKVDRLRHAPKDLFATLASKMARFAEDYSEQVQLARPELPDALSDRAQDNWEPLLAIASCAGPAWIERATNAALALSDAAQPSVSIGNELLDAIRTVFKQKATFKIRTVDLIEALVKDETNAWATYNRGKPINPRQLAKMLSAYDIRPKTVRNGEDTPKGYDKDQFTDAFARYLKAPESTTPEKLLQHRNASSDPTSDATDIADAAARAAEIQLLMDAIDPTDCGGVADTLHGDAEDRSLDY